MSDNYINIIPKKKDYPNRKEKAQEILDWLISEDIVKAVATDSVLGKNEGYSVSEGAEKVVKYPEEIPIDLWTNGLEIVTETEVFHPGEFYDEDEGSELLTTNLGFRFWNWPPFKPEFLDEFRDRLGCEIEVMFGRL